METMVIAKIESTDTELVQRLYDLGLHPGLEIKIVSRVSFGSVTIIQYGSTRLALNAEEFACLRGR
jgi:Fe2+ transport system protein FeoA